ncbi:MAG: AAA family ATPase [Planctomycetia bacterium]|nr:AAA family ATPase [Planctomycetia bacterium]
MKAWWQHSWAVLWGPPGTGKTYTTGQQIAAVLHDRRERILVVSTTNRATDAVALALGNAAKSKCRSELDHGRLLRIGKGASYQTFVNQELESMLRGTEAETLAKIDGLSQQLPLFESWEDKALTRKQIGELRAGGSDQSKRVFVDPDVRVVVATAFKAMAFLNDDLITKMIENGEAPFTTVVIDEAGLISRAAIAALSLLASLRVVLVGDSKQLAPISRISRILPTRQETWLASSGLSHLDDIEATPTAVHVLSEQRRMHPDVCHVVSEFQYGGFLTTATETANRESNLPGSIAEHSRAIWYVLDAEDVDLATIRAERGPGNRSWIRSITPSVLEKLFSAVEVKRSNGLFISPYKAQAQVVSQLLASWGMTTWEASTVHSQQGSEADIVVFDTVNAGSCTWPFDEWKRLVNVALSRAREAIIVLSSRDEMEEPYLRPLLRRLTPSVLVVQGNAVSWQTLDHDQPSMPSKVQETSASYVPRSKSGQQAGGKLGDQLADRKKMRPVLSQEQQRLSNLELDGKPRLVRGVAGSGKSLVLCNWLAKIARRTQEVKNFRIWAVYANRSLQKLLRQSIEAAWKESSKGQLFDAEDFPWQNVSLLHVKDVLAGLLIGAGMSIDAFEFDYDRAAEEFLNRQDASDFLPRCNALFIDEAQDMGPSTLKLLLSIVEQCDPEDDNSRSAHIFYDNAQNIYGRRTPRWSEFGVDMRGRATIMKESFRSTNPVTEFAVNMLHRLSPSSTRQDQAELMSMGLMERIERNGQEWLAVKYNQVFGPKPIFRKFTNVEQELQSIGSHLKYLITKEGVSPEDICLIYNGSKAVELLESRLGPAMAEIGVELSVQTSRSFQRQKNTLLVTTSHSFKGYEAEVVLIPCADHYVTGDNQILANNLYVAMTRARSLLAVYSLDESNPAVRQLNAALQFCVDAQGIPGVRSMH